MKVGRKPADPGDRRDVKGSTKVDAKGDARRGKKDDPKKVAKKAGTATARRRTAESPARGGRSSARRPHEPRAQRQGPQTAPVARPAERPARAKNVSQAKARAKARKAKAPKIVRLPLRERLIARLATIDLRPQRLIAKVPFVVLVIGSLGAGLAATLWLSTDAAQRSYQLGSARSTNEALSQQKEALERDVLEAESAPALAESARNLGMIPSKDTAHLVQDPTGNWTVVGKPKPAEGVPPPPLNNKLPDAVPPPPAAPAPPAAAAPKPGSSPEVPVRVVPTPLGALPFNGTVPLPPGAVMVPPGVSTLSPGALTLPAQAQPGALALPATAPLPGVVPPAPVAEVLPAPLPAPADVTPPVLTPDVPAVAPVAPAGAGQ